MATNEEKNYPQDSEGFKYVTDALMTMANSFPALQKGEQFKFSTIPTEEGLSIIASAGSFIIQEKRSITDHIWQICAYPFMVVMRSSGLSTKHKIQSKEWLDSFAEWLLRKEIIINGEKHRLKWPDLSGDREIWEITRQSPAYLGSINEDKSENWVMDMTIQYRNEFDT